MKRHREEMMGLWSYVLCAVLLASLIVFVLLVTGLVPVWVAASSLPPMLATYVIWDKKTDPVNDTWGEGARGEEGRGGAGEAPRAGLPRLPRLGLGPGQRRPLRRRPAGRLRRRDEGVQREDHRRGRQPSEERLRAPGRERPPQVSPGERPEGSRAGRGLLRGAGVGHAGPVFHEGRGRLLR